MCPPGDMICDSGMDMNGCWMGDYCLPAGNICPPVCYSYPPSNCSSSEVVCDMGYHGDCWNGDYCMPEGTVCPVACYTPEPSMCAGDDILCDNGMDSNGCWMGDYCMPAGSICPTIPY